MNEDVKSFNRDQRIRREAYAAALDECGYIGMGGPINRAASRYPLRRRVPRVVKDPHSAGEWRLGGGATDYPRVQWQRTFDATTWGEVPPSVHLTVERVRVLATLIEDPWTWEDDPSPELAALP